MAYSARAANQRKIAVEALAAWGQAEAGFYLLKHGTTTTFQVQAHSGNSTLRLQPSSHMPFSVVMPELHWLTDIRKDTNPHPWQRNGHLPARPKRP